MPAETYPVKPPRRRSALPEAAVETPAGGLPERRVQRDRRRHSLGSFFYGGFRPRRRHGRRQGDHNLTFPDWHEPRLLFLAVAIVLMSCADALFTLKLLAAGGSELNGFMRALLASDADHFVWVKIGITCVAVIPLVIAARRHLLGWFPVVRVLQFFCAGYALLMVYEIYLLGWQATRVGPQTVDQLMLWVAG